MLWFVGRNLPTYCRNPRRGKRGYDQKTYLKTAHNFANIVRLKKCMKPKEHIHMSYSLVKLVQKI